MVKILKVSRMRKYRLLFISTAHYILDIAASSFTVNVNCPRSLNINALPAFFGAVSMLAQIVSQLDPETYRALILSWMLEFVRNQWYARDTDKTGFLRRDQALEVLYGAAGAHFKHTLLGLSPSQKDSLISSFGQIGEGDEFVSLSSVEKAIESNTSYNHFVGCREIDVRNATGGDLRVGASNSFQCLPRDSTGSILIQNESSQLSFSIERYKPVRGVNASPYQSMLLPLTRHRRKSRRRGRKDGNSSGFR